MAGVVDIFEIGSAVRIGDKIEGIITAACIRGNNAITYEVAWWDGNNRHSDWLNADEIQPFLDTATQRIGFKC